MADIVTYIPGVAIVLVGIMIATVSPETLLRFDGQTGRAIFNREMERSGDRERALRAARWFYRLLGGYFVLFGSLWLLASACETIRIFSK